MRWTEPFLLACLVASWCVTALVESPPEPKQITVYAPLTSYSLPVVGHDGTDYVGLAELLEPLGQINARLEGQKWKLRYEPSGASGRNEREAQFQAGKTKAKVQKRDLELTAPFLVAEGRGLIPISSLVPVLSRMLAGEPLNYHEASRRLFLDKAEVRYTAEIKKKATPSQLVIRFSAPVNPSISTEPGKLRLVFRHEPLLPQAGAESLSFDDKLIAGLVYSEANGRAELSVNSVAPSTASFSDDRKSITVTTLAPLPVTPAKPQPLPPIANLPEGRQQPSPVAVASASASLSRFLVVIDPAHGGEDTGGTITSKLMEKDVDLGFARVLRHELEVRGITTKLLRESDATLTIDQRAVLANGAMPSLFLSLHATNSGSGVHVFTAKLTASQKTSAFLPWDSAQAAYLASSQEVADAVTTELLKRDVSTIVLPSCLRPLNNIAAPAIAIELARPSGGSIEEENSPSYQQAIGTAIANAVANLHARLTQGEGKR